MKISKIFGCVLGLHACIIAVLIVQPGCQTAQPPTQTYTQDRAVTTPSYEFDRGAVSVGGDGSLDSAFNAGFEDEAFAPRNDVSSSETLEPIPSLEPINEVSQVAIAGDSFETYTVKKGDSLWKISREHSVSLNDLYEANGLNKNSVLSVGQQIQIPVEGSSASIQSVTPDVYQPTGYNQNSATYTVEKGDNLTKIAKRFDSSVRAIRAANNKNSDVIRVGEVLVIPVGDEFTPSTTYSPTTTPAPAPAVTNTDVHVVKAGEYPGVIAKKYGMTTKELLSINSISDPRRIQIGQRLKVSSTGSANNIATRTETVVSASPSVAVEPAPEPQVVEEVTVIEADPLLEGEFQTVEIIVADEPVQAVDTVEEVEIGPFENAVEIPVIRLEE